MKMTKIAIALALLGSMSAPAIAATSNVDISGTMDMSVSSISGKPSDPLATENSSETNVSSNNSNLVLKGSEDLGDGVKALWQVQTYFSAGGTDSKASANGSLSNGDTFLGLGSGMGTLRLGNMDSPVKNLGRKADLFSNHLADSRNLTQEKYGDVRMQNSVRYDTPSFSGFSGSIAYSSNLDATAATSASADMYSLSGNYSNGPLFAGVGFESRDLAVGDDPDMWRLVGGYKFGDAKVVGLWQSASNTTGAAGADDDRDVWGIGGAYAMGAFTFKAQYYGAGDLGSTADSGADMWAIGADYSLSKRTTVYAGYAATSNDDGAAFSVSGGGFGDNMGSVAGDTTSGFQMGVAHSF